MTERIDHAAEAVKHIEWAHNQQAEQGEFDFTVRDNALIAQVHATLALVEQQRIANIIAIANNVSDDPEVMVTAGERAAWVALCEEDSPHDLRKEIKEVLGL